ncbi:MAG: hypothetical protein ACXWW9_00665 [Actinomycetota bacterium]
MKKILAVVPLLLMLMIVSTSTAHALPGTGASAVAEPWPEVGPASGSRVRAVQVVGGTIWLAGKFSTATDSSGATRSVSNLVAFNAGDGRFASLNAPGFGGSGAEIWDLDVRGGELIVGGKFANPASSAQKNLAAVNLSTGAVRWFKGVPTAKTVLVNGDSVYAAGTTLGLWNATTGSAIWKGRTKVTVQAGLRGHSTPPAYRQLVLAGGALFAACQCDFAGGQPVKALIKLSTDGTLDPSWVPSDLTPGGAANASGATGIAVVTDGSALYLGAGGSDFVAKYSFAEALQWKRDTSGSVQALGILDGRLVVGGHFVEIADATGDRCGFKSSNPGDLDPFGECVRHDYLAAYAFTGALDPWTPSVTGKFNGIWDLEPEGTALHFGGEFTKVNGVRANFYGKLI